MPTHAERQIIPYRPDQLFDLVADVGKYPEFLPWCVGARIRTRTERDLVADLTIGFGPFRESFTSRVALDRPERVKVRYENGPFRYLNNQWTFTPHDDGTELGPLMAVQSPPQIWVVSNPRLKGDAPPEVMERSLRAACRRIVN